MTQLMNPSLFSKTPGYGGMSLNDYQSMSGYGQPTTSLTGLSTTSGVLDDVSNAGAAATPSNWWDGFLQQRDAKGITSGGWGQAGLGIASGAINAWLGLKQYGLAKDTLNANKEQFALNYGAQKATTNSALEDRQRARVASNAGAYESVGKYMQKNGIV